MRSNGGDFFDTENMKSVLDSPENLETLKWIQDIAQKGFTPANNTGADLDNIMMADQLGMYVNGPWLSTGLRDNEINFGVTGMPAGKKDTIGVAEEYGFAVPKSTPTIRWKPLMSTSLTGILLKLPLMWLPEATAILRSSSLLLKRGHQE